MKIYNLAEELEKERQKNKELEKENKKLKEQIEYLKKDGYLNQIKYERDLNENINKELGDRIDKAIDILEKDENKEPIEVILNNVGKALDILKGE